MRILWVARLTMGDTLGKMAAPYFFEIPYCLERMGHNVKLVVPTFSKRKEVRIPKSVQIQFLPTIRFSFLTTLSFWIILLFYLPMYVVKRKPHVIIVDYYSFFGVLGVILFGRVNCVLDVRSPPVETNRFGGLLSQLIYSPVLFLAKNSCRGITVITPTLKEEICRAFKIRPEKIGIWTSGVSLSLFNNKYAQFEGEKLREAFGLSGKFVVMYHGVISHTRGLQETIDALKRLNSVEPSVVFFMLGKGRAREDLALSILKKKVQSNVFIYGPVDYLEVPKYVSMCDIGIIPLPNISWWKGSSALKLLEYLAMEKPVIATDIPFHRVVIGKSDCGVLIKNNAPEEIAGAILHLLQNRSRLKEMGVRGRRIAESYSWSEISRRLYQFLVKVTASELE